ncbi:hypothetical protein [Arthrobacter silvisoli]|uniref:hypothetical protein n=1 Tax=Arthrobacter silvisoli TaxID=2291022 RepID=UPI000E212125|nr:hypothetical protein [Arthrobacter silvisoli]
MKKTVSSVLIVGFLVVDFLVFHDLLKPGEVITLPQYLTGILSILVIALSVRELLAHPKKTQPQ